MQRYFFTEKFQLHAFLKTILEVVYKLRYKEKKRERNKRMNFRTYEAFLISGQVDIPNMMMHGFNTAAHANNLQCNTRL